MGTLEHSGVMRPAQAGPVTALIAQIMLLAVLAETVGLGWAGWIAGATCALVTNVVLARGVVRFRCDRLGPATWVTLCRLTLGIGVAAMVADTFSHERSRMLLVTLASVALALDWLDGWVARRTGSASELGARLDGEVDAFLLLVLSAVVARSAGAWVLAIGGMRYAFAAAGWPLRWMRARLPARDWRKVVTAVQGIVLVVAAAEVLPSWVIRSALVAALVLLVESFGRDVWWLWSHRDATSRAVAAAADEGPDHPVASQIVPGRGRRVRAAALTILALLLVWVALIAPNRLSHLTPSSFVRLPIEGLVVIVLACVLPATARRILAWVVGAALGLLLVVRLLDMGFYASFDRPFNPVDDWSYAGIGVETLQDSIGHWRANLVVALAAVLIVGIVVLVPLAMVRLTRTAARRRRWSLGSIAALGVVWVAFRAFGAPVASASAADLAVTEGQAVRTGLQGRAAFARELRDDPFRATPGDRLLTGLRGKDVLLVFVESYGKVAVQDPSISPGVAAVVETGTRQLRGAGFSSRSAYLTSATFGGLSWLGHSTLQAGVWVNSQRRYNQLVTSDRFTLSAAFKRAGWRTVGDVPSNNRRWPEGSTFYRYDTLYDQRNLGYRGPRFGYASMPDQYTLLALQRLELARPSRPPIFAEVDLVSSHVPWTRIPELIDWGDVGDGSIFHRVPVDATTQGALFSDREKVRAAYGRSIEYSLSALFSFVQRYGDDDLVLIVLGDHQPQAIVTGEGASRDVPISVIARDPAVLEQIGGWNWEQGLWPSPRAPVWQMDSFRDRFLRAFGSQPTGGGEPDSTDRRAP